MLAPAYFPHQRVSSALGDLTSVFGMRTGIPLPTKHQHEIFDFNTVLQIWIFENGANFSLFAKGLALRLGFEPRLTESGSAVLPLNDLRFDWSRWLDFHQRNKRFTFTCKKFIEPPHPKWGAPNANPKRRKTFVIYIYELHPVWKKVLVEHTDS